MPKQLSPLLALTHLGLSEGEISIYTALLEHGQLEVAAIIEKSGLKKGDCYNKLYSLNELGLIEEVKKGKIQQYRLADPKTLEHVASRQFEAASQAKRELESILPDILSTYTLTYHKPGIVLFEGEEAMRRVLEDSLSSVGDILQYVDLETVMYAYPEINAAYNKKRTIQKIKKRTLVSDNPTSRKYAAIQNSLITEVRLINFPLANFGAVMQVYNNKTSYLTLKPEGMIGVIIEDPLISQMHRSLFEFNWSVAQPAS